ncbi:hypothetical protein [Corallococcus carmarthensis]|nr:hypothetical protein [Corallococcus carmarthensis]
MLRRLGPEDLEALEGHFIENIFFKGAWGDEFQYAMLAREWTPR